MSSSGANFESLGGSASGIPLAQKGAAEGVATLNSETKLPLAQVPKPNAGGYYETTFGNTSATNFTIEHKLNTLTPNVTIINQSTSLEEGCKIEIINANKIKLSATAWETSPPGTAAYRVSVDASSGLVNSSGSSLTNYVEKGEIGANSGVAPLEAAGKLPVEKLSSIGYAPSVIWLDTTPEFYGALGNGSHDDTEAFQKCSAAIKAAGGGIGRLSARTYIVDGYEWESGVKWVGRGSRGEGTVIKARSGSSNTAQITMAVGVVNEGGWKGIRFMPNGNSGQSCMYYFAQESSETHNGGIFNSSFEDVQFGSNGTGESWEGNAIWLRGGATVFNLPHQFITFKNVRATRLNTGANAAISRCIKMSGQTEKIKFDAACVFNGSTTGSSLLGTNLEMSREFLIATTNTVEAVAGATTITVSSVTGFENNKRFSIGEGAFNDLCQVESIAGKVITLKSPLSFSHAIGTNLYLLSGTVAAPAENAPAFINFELGAIQNGDLGVLIDHGAMIDFNGSDFEQLSRSVRIRDKSFQINLHDVRPANASSEGTANGTGVATVGSKIITGATGTWAETNTINGPGIVGGTTVTKITGSELELSAVVESNGSESAQTISLVKGGSGKGYIASYEENSTGIANYHLQGSSDRGIVRSESSVRIGNNSISTPVANQTSSGITPSIASASSVSIFSAREIALTNATTIIKTVIGQHSTGDVVTFRATAANITFESGGNLYIPSTKLILQIGDFATFLRTDYSTTTWALVGVQRAKENTIPLGTNGLVYPFAASGPIPANTAAIGTAFKAWFGRAIVPETGTLEKVKVFVGSTIGGETKAAIFDCGEAHANNITVLWESSGKEIASGEKEKLIELGNPKLPVVDNQQIILALMTNSTTATYGRTSLGFGSWGELGTGFFPSSTNLEGRMAAQTTYGSLSFGGAGAQLAVSSFLPGGNVPGLIAYV